MSQVSASHSGLWQRPSTHETLLQATNAVKAVRAELRRLQPVTVRDDSDDLSSLTPDKDRDNDNEEEDKDINNNKNKDESSEQEGQDNIFDDEEANKEPEHDLDKDLYMLE
jgi:hypothetical protein